jgi:hypothetical protein
MEAGLSWKGAFYFVYTLSTRVAVGHGASSVGLCSAFAFPMRPAVLKNVWR